MEIHLTDALLDSFFEKREVFFFGIGSAFAGVVNLLVNRGTPDAH
jgi:C4-dicarboxylate transporter